MRILVINRIDDSACREAMNKIPESDVRAVGEANCVKSFNEFAPRVVVIWNPADPELPTSMLRNRDGLRIWSPLSLSLRENPYRLFINDHSITWSEFVPGVMDLDELAVRVVERCVPEVSILITDPDEVWQKALKRDLSEIPGAVVSAHDGSIRLGDAMLKIQDLAPDIVVMNWLDTLTPNLIRGYAKDPFRLMIAVLSGISERMIIGKGPNVDFVLSKSSPIEALVLVVKGWTEQIQARKRDELREGLLKNQR